MPGALMIQLDYCCEIGAALGQQVCPRCHEFNVEMGYHCHTGPGYVLCSNRSQPMPYAPSPKEPFQEGLPELDLAETIAHGWIVLIVQRKGYDLEQPWIGRPILGVQVWTLDPAQSTHTWNGQDVYVHIHKRSA
ncbi:MAG: hypothetical protein KGL39_06900 [Patescibacteria group bacterium]|nr:hypothetical protein [Patescibacteria group bacterium]